VPRTVVALAWAGEPVWDGHYYDFGARRIAEGLGYSDDRAVAGALVWHPWCHYPVGYSGFLALFYRLLGAHQEVAAVANSLTGAALAVVTWALAGHALSRWRARMAGLLVALHPGLILYAALVMTEPLAALLTLAAFWLAVRDARPSRGLVLGALTMGVAALVRPQALLCAPFLAVVVTAGGQRGERGDHATSPAGDPPQSPASERSFNLVEVEKLTKEQANAEHERLGVELRRHSEAYYAKDAPTISDAEFWRLFTEFSEPTGDYPYQNFMTNEETIQDIMPVLTKVTKPGGVYLGVAPEQNFTYIAALRPRVAFIIDIRRQNMLQHLFLKALFDLSSSRAEFLSRFFGREVPSLSPASALPELLRAVRRAGTSDSLYQRDLAAVIGTGDRLASTALENLVDPGDGLVVFNVNSHARRELVDLGDRFHVVGHAVVGAHARAAEPDRRNAEILSERSILHCRYLQICWWALLKRFPRQGKGVFAAGIGLPRADAALPKRPSSG